MTAADAFITALGGVTGWSTQVLAPTMGVRVLQPVRLLLNGPTAMVFTLQ